MEELREQTRDHWKFLRSRTYDLLDAIRDIDLLRKLPFEESQTILYQFICMLGTTETFIDYIRTGYWGEWHSSLEQDNTDTTKAEVKASLEKSDKALLALLDSVRMLEKQEDDLSPLQKYFTLVEHEAHHHGQLINFIYAFDLPIPKSWADLWALKKPPVKLIR